MILIRRVFTDWEFNPKITTEKVFHKGQLSLTVGWRMITTNGSHNLESAAPLIYLEILIVLWRFFWLEVFPPKWWRKFSKSIRITMHTKLSSISKKSVNKPIWSTCSKQAEETKAKVNSKRCPKKTSYPLNTNLCLMIKRKLHQSPLQKLKRITYKQK